MLGHGFINEIEQTTMLAEMERWHPDGLFVALGVPKQELWIADHLTQKIPTPWATTSIVVPA
ncbi:MAG: WecB/TagA/CpsF family glycosyltransferase [Mycobacterium sp.]|nr:WecB/TagA/CpsF family glycosyltransferase [Mycobacterium sp.]